MWQRRLAVAIDFLPDESTKRTKTRGTDFQIDDRPILEPVRAKITEVYVRGAKIKTVKDKYPINICMLLFWRHFREERGHVVLLQGGLYLLVKFGREGLPCCSLTQLFAALL